MAADWLLTFLLVQSHPDLLSSPDNAYQADIPAIHIQTNVSFQKNTLLIKNTQLRAFKSVNLPHT